MKKIQEAIIEVCLKILRKNEGAVIVFGDAAYSPMVNQESVKPFNVLDNPKLLISLASMDGACIVGKDGILKAYGVNLQNRGTQMLNVGTRHQGAIYASKRFGNIVYLASKSDKKVKVYQEGKEILRIDALEPDIEKRVPEISNILESIAIGTLGVIGTSTLGSLGFLGVSWIPGVLVFGGLYYLMNIIKSKKIMLNK